MKQDTVTPRPILDLFREGHDMQTIAYLHQCPVEFVEDVIREALTHSGWQP